MGQKFSLFLEYVQKSFLLILKILGSFLNLKGKYLGDYRSYKKCIVLYNMNSESNKKKIKSRMFSKS